MSNRQNDRPDLSVALDDTEADLAASLAHTDETPFDPSWLHRSEVMNRIGCSPTTLRRMIERGQLHPRQVDGHDRFDPTEVARFISTQGVGQPIGGRGGAAPAGAPWSPQGGDPAAIGAAQVIRASTALTEQAQSHLEKMFEMTRKTTEVLLEAVTEQMKLSHAQTLELEKQNMDMRAAAERAKTEEHQRQLATLEYQRKARMQERAFESLKAMLPLVKWYLVKKHPELLGLDTRPPAKVEVPRSAVVAAGSAGPANSNAAESVAPAVPTVGESSVFGAEPGAESAEEVHAPAVAAAKSTIAESSAAADPKPGLDAMLVIAENICTIVAELSDDQMDKLRSSGALAPEHVDALAAIRRELRAPG